MVQYFPVITGSLTVNGNLSVSGNVAVTGSMSGTSSLAANAELLSGTGSVGFTTTGSFTVASSSLSSRTTQIESVYATTGSNSFRATQSITGSLTVTGQIVAQTLNVQQVTSSIVYSSGSNVFGCDINSRQTFTGSFYQTGSVAVFNSNVGIGTINPNYRLEVCGPGSNINIIGASSGDIATGFRIGRGASLGAEIYDNPADNITTINVTGGLNSRTGGAGRLAISSTGVACFSCQVCVPLLTVNAAVRLYGSGGGIGCAYIVTSAGADEQPAIILEKAGGYGQSEIRTYYNNVPNYGLAFRAGNTTGMYLNSSGYLGIGTSCPIGPLHIFSSLGNNPVLIEGNASSNAWVKWKSGLYCSSWQLGAANGGFIFYDDINGIERMRITNGADVQLNNVGSLYSTTSIIGIPNSATTIFTSTGYGGVWLVTYNVAGNPAQVGYAIVGNAFGSTLTLLASAAGSQTSLSVSGLNLQLSQSAGGTINTRINVIKLNNTIG